MALVILFIMNIQITLVSWVCISDEDRCSKVVDLTAVRIGSAFLLGWHENITNILSESIDLITTLTKRVTSLACVSRITSAASADCNVMCYS
jgi:hypothetical protein